MVVPASQNAEQQPEVPVEATVNAFQDQQIYPSSDNLNQYLPPTIENLILEQNISRQPPKVPKSGRKPTKPRLLDSVRREKRPISETPRWSSITSTIPPQNQIQMLDRSTVRPRVWTSSRKELVSTFVELAGSERTSNISWTTTDMPIMILEDATVMLERPSHISDELYMDVIFVREFIHAVPGPSPQTNNIPSPSVEAPVLPTEGKQGNVDVASTMILDQGNPSPNAPEQINHLPNDSHATSSNMALHSATPLGQPASIPKPRSRPMTDSRKRLKGTRITYSSISRRVLPSAPVERPKPSVQLKVSVLPKPKPLPPSLRFKKVKTASPDVIQNDPSPPCAAPSMPNWIHLQGLTLGAVRAIPPVDPIPQLPPGTEPCFPRYPDNRRLPELTKTFEKLESRKKGFSLPLSSLAGSMGSKDNGLFDDLCRCSRFNYSRSCRVCGDGGNVVDRFMPTFRLPDDPFSRSEEVRLPIFPSQTPYTGVATLELVSRSISQELGSGESAMDVAKNTLSPSTASDQAPSIKTSTTGESHLAEFVLSCDTAASVIANDIIPEQAGVIDQSTSPSTDPRKQHFSPESPHNTPPEVLLQEDHQVGYSTKRKRNEEALSHDMNSVPIDVQMLERNKRPKSDTRPVTSQNIAAPTLAVKNEPTTTQEDRNGVPPPIPIEIQVLVDSYISSNAVGVFASRYHLEQFWHLNLDDEISHAFMGLYRICRIWEALRSPGGEQLNIENGTRKGQVEWRFRMKWEPGGEDWQSPGIQERLESPWWNPIAKASGLVANPQTELEDSDNESTPVYQLARRSHANFSRRHCYFNRLYFSVLPFHLLAPIDVEIPDAQLPRGWHCRDCGKLNFRYYLRHSRCRSSYCKEKSQRKGYAVEVDRLRDPQEMLPLTLPVNKYPNQAELKVLSWNDHVQTCICKMSSQESRPLVLQHIFTCNLQDLQRDASDLFNEIQIHVPLRRQTDGSNPYFEFTVGPPNKEVELENNDNHWDAVQSCIQNARNLMNRQGQKYGNKRPTELNIENLTIRAWVSPGSKRSSDTLCAKDRCVVIMCLGCEVTITISPKSAIKNNLIQKPDLSSLIPMGNLDGETDSMEVSLEKGIKAEIITKDSEILQSATSTNQEGQNPTKTELSISLVHGDVLLLEGADFEVWHVNPMVTFLFAYRKFSIHSNAPVLVSYCLVIEQHQGRKERLSRNQLNNIPYHVSR